MAQADQKLRFSVAAVHQDAHGSGARTKQAEITLDTNFKSRATPSIPPNSSSPPATSKASSASRPPSASRRAASWCASVA